MPREAGLAAVLLDMDGTLVDSHPALQAAYRRFVTAHGGTPSDEEYARWNGPPLRAIVAGLKEAHAIPGEPAALLAEYVALLQGSYLSDARLVPGAEALLDRLRARGVKLALVTSAPAQLAAGMLAARGVAHCFDAVVAGDEVPHGKPAPDGYQVALARLGVAPEGAVAVEDSATGVRSACGAGVRCLGVGPAGAALLRAGALAVATDLLEAGEHLDALVRGEPGRVLPARAIAAVVEGPPRSYDAATEDQVATRWQAALRALPSLHDGAIVVADALERDGQGGLVVRAGLCRYRHFVAQRGGLPLGLRGLGVTALTVVHHRGAALLCLGKRSQAVTQYPGCWELLPSGSVPRARIGAGGVVDLQGQLLEELTEELGVPPAGARLSPLAVVEDLAEHVVDAAYRLDLEADPAELARHVQAADEHHQLAFLPLDEAVARPQGVLERARPDGLVPTVLPLLGLLRG